MEDKDKTLEELMESITHPKKLSFLEQYPKFKLTNKTAGAIGIVERTVYRWLREDVIFQSALSYLKKDIEAKMIELHEQNIDDIALDPTTKSQSRIFGSLVRLRAAWPEKYRESSLIDKAIIGDIIVKMAIPAYDESLRITGGEDATIEGEKQGKNEDGEAV